MKLLFLSLSIIFLFIIGCSSVSKVSNYSSKEEFYEDLNNSIKNRDFNVVMADSSFTYTSKGSQIKNDSLYAITYVQEKKEIIPLNDIKEIKYYGKTYETPSAYIWLKSNKKLKGEDVKILSDSSVQFTSTKINYEYVPINRVKEIQYTSHWKGAIIGGIIGAIPLGIVETYQWGEITMATTMGIVTGGILGGIIGYIMGNDYVFQFNH